MSANMFWARGACLCVLFGLAAGLQSAGLTVGAGSALPGGTASVSVLLSPPQGSSVAALQFDLVYGPALSAGTAAAGAAAVSAGKNLYANTLGNGVERFLIAGLNQAALSQGSVVDLTICVAAGTASGAYALQIQNVAASDPNGNALSLSAANGSVTVPSLSSSSPTIVFGALSNMTFGAAPFSLSATASSGLPVSFASTTPAVCTVSGNTVTIVASGACSIAASQAGNANYAAAAPVTQSFTVNPAAQTIAFGALGSVTFGVAPFTVGATASSGLPVSFASATPAVCTVFGNAVTVVSDGVCSVTASQPGNANYGPATPVTQSFAVGAAILTVATPAMPAGTAGAPFTQTLSASGGVPPYHNWVLSSGALPPGLTLYANSGAIAGVPVSAAGSPFNFGVIVKDSTGDVSAPRTFSIGIAQPPALTIVTSSPLPEGAAGDPYAQAVVAAGGVTPYANWAITAGNPPPGISLSGAVAGLLSGTPTAAGTFTFTVQATDGANETVSQQFSLTVNPAGTVTIAPDGIVNAASYMGGGVAPGEAVTIFGSGLGPNAPAYQEAGNNGGVATTLGGVQVLFDGVAAPVLYAQASQVGVVAPYEIDGETSTQVQVIYQGQNSVPLTVPVVSAAPGVFTLDYFGSGEGAILNQDGTVNSVSDPAPAGSSVTVYATGEGQTSPLGVDGEADGPSAPRPVQAVTATIGGMAANVQYAGGAAGVVAGVLQVVLQTPAALASGAWPVVLNIGGATSQAGVTLAVKASGNGNP